jgi:hypothetical protein
VVLADRLRDARRRRFVGRAAELELFESALDGSPLAVLFIHGPGGVGKTALLAAFAEAAERRGVAVTRVDLRSIELSPPGFEAAIPALRRRHVLLLDTYEAAAGLDTWLRERYLPELPEGVLVVIAGRDPPTAAWRADAGWRELLRVVSLRNLDPDDARRCLEVEGVPEALHAGALAVTHGHPLALRLFIDVAAQGKAPVDLGEAPDVVRELLARFVADAPSARHRQALEVCAHARATTEDLLRTTLGGDDGAELFAWLRALSFVDEGPHGAFPHDIARDALDADLRWRDPDRYRELHRGVRRHVLAHIEGPAEVADLIFLHRGNPFTSAFWDWESFGLAYPDRLRAQDHEALLAMVERHETAASRALAEHWLDRQPSAFVVFRGSDGDPIGFYATLALHEASEADLAADPGATAMWEYAQRHAPPRPGEEVLAGRWFMDGEAYQRPSASFNVLTVSATTVWFTRPRLARELIGCWTDPDAIAPMMAYIDYQRVPEADYAVAGVRYGVFTHDWRQVAIEPWLELMAGRELDAGFEPPATATELALSQTEFTAAVRAALRDLHRPDALAANPLQRTRMARGGDLTGLIEQAVAALRADPRDAKLARALDRTYLRPAPTQERAAELLDLPFSTYRRHLARGTERVASWLWQRELYGPE